MSKPRFTRSQAIAALLIGLIVIAGGIARANAIGTNTHLSADENGYVGNANRILADERYATFKWPPGTSVAFAVATRLSGHHSLRLATHASGPAQYVQLAIGISTLVLVAALVWILAGPWAAVIATALVAGYVPLVVATRTFLSEPLGALMLVAAVAAAVLAHRRLGGRRELLALGAAGVVGGLACLTRSDLAVGMAVIALALALAGRPNWRTAVKRGGVYLVALLLTLSPWLAYASDKEGRFVPITNSGPDAFFIGSYLPGKGALVPTEEQLAPEVCRHFPQDCGRYWQHSAAPVFRLIEARHPGLSENDAVNKENLENVRKYALGKPAAFTAMLWGKFWKMWDNVWSGGNGTYHPDTSKTQHAIYLWLAWIGLLAGLALTRRFVLVVSTGVLLSVAALATLFNDQPRYNVSLMALLLSSGTIGAWLAVEKLVAMWRARAAARVPSAHTAH
ncbi:MAG TPA: glycosyltransferase family 39 protein [Solirubrobacteraceae bacterium]|nr:glycosyltransferase family 39 protein [Solirubrobacteraceae bacterium]